MRTINFNEEDIKQCKLALAKQNLTSLQSAFLMQYITNIEQENKQLKDELKSKPDVQITLQDDKGNKFMVIQTERIDMQVELNKTIEKLFNNWNKLKEYLHNVDVVIDYSENYDGRFINYDELIDKMQELEGSDSNDSN